jgi:hypothetical protein
VTKETESKALATVEGEGRNASLASFLDKFDMSMPFTPENVQKVTDRFHFVSRMHAAVGEICVVDHGKGFIWLKAGMKHGEWLDYLKTNCPAIPLRTVQWWMAEARYTIEHGHRRNAQAALLGQQSGAHFDDTDEEGLSADDLADPSKPAPKPRSELEAMLARLEKRLEARDKREEKLLEQVQGLEARLKVAERKKDPDEIDEENTPIKSALLKALLASGRARMLIQDAVNMKIDIFGDCPAKVLASVQSQLQTNIQTICDMGRPLILASVVEHNRKKKAESAGNPRHAGG